MSGNATEKRNMKQLDKWAKGKPLGLVIIAQQAAVGVEDLVKWLKSIKVEDQLGNDKPPLALKEWQPPPSIKV
jgi:hypothetical protein